MEKMTIFYNKRLGVIKEVCDGSQSMNWYGKEAEDYSRIYDYIIIKHDQFIHDNFNNMKIVDGKPKLMNDSMYQEYL